MTNWPRRHFSAGLASLLAPWLAGVGPGLPAAWAQDRALPVPDALPVVAAAAALKGEPLVLLVSLHGCPYCELVRRHYLLPARAEGLPVWQINMHDQRRPLVGFDGRRTNAVEQLARWNIALAPTVLFLGLQGQELAERLPGMASVDFYGAYLDERLATARQRVKSAGLSG